MRLAVFVALVACHSAESNSPPATGSGSASAAPAVAAPKPKPPEEKQDYVPAEFKSGMSKWKDIGVYVDGQPAGFLSFGELPIGLKPVFVKDKVSAEKRAGTKDLGWRWAQQRFYRFSDYLVAIGIDLKKVKEVHVYASKFPESIVVTGKDLQSPAAKEFMFRFGGDIAGKVIPKVPPNFGNRRAPDKATSVMVYIDKKPPVLDQEQEAFILDGQKVLGVPYYGDPVRGGVRVYLDDKLVTIIKRQELDAKKARTAPDGELEWKLGDFFAAHGVDTSKVVEAYVIRGERRNEKLSKAELDADYFSAGSQAHGGVLLGDKRVRANSIAMHTRALAADELPQILPEEEP